MNRKLKIFQVRLTKISSISPRKLSERKEYLRMIKNSNFFIENGQDGDFHLKINNPSLPTLKELV